MTDHGRKQELLDVAELLFEQKGFDSTTVNDIIGELEVSKGAFYHYFKSKDDVLAAVAERHIAAEVELAQSAARADALKGPAKLTRLLCEVLLHNIHTADHRRRISSLFEHDGNARLLRKVVEKKIRAIHPAYTQIIKQGIDEGLFTTAFPEEVAEQIINLIQHLNSVIARLMTGGKESLLPLAQRKLLACQESIERLLGAEPGSIDPSPILQQIERQIT